jgi:HSP20 family protein
MNQANNFWDFVASLQNNQGASPFAEGRGPAAEFNPFEGQEQFWGPWAHRGRRHGPPHGRHGPHGHGHRHGTSPPPPPPPPGHEGSVPPPPPPPHVEEPSSRSPSPHTPPETPAEPHHHPRPQSHPRRGGPGHHHHGEHPHRGRGGRGPRGGHHNHPRGGPPAFPFDLNALAEAFAPALFGGNAFGGPNPDAFANTREEQSKTAKTNDGTFTPSIDLFSTPTSYILHTSLPGAKKSDLDITYNGTRNSITISGVITRPDVSETMMNCLIQDERREVGMFEREIKLEDGVKIDEEKIGAKLEDGVLRVIVPKITEEEEGWESVRKVELE